MRIIYIPVSKKIKKKNLRNFIKSFLYDHYIVLRNFFINKKITTNTSGYIDAALQSNAYVLELPYNYCIIFSKILNLLFDGIFINWKFTSYRSDLKDIEKKLLKLSKKYKIKKIIIDGRDQSFVTIDNKILDNFDYVIKREKNKKIINNKYLTTILPCVLISNYYKISKNKEESINWSKIGNSKPNNNPTYDIFFSGKKTSESRKELVEFLSSKDLNFFGRVDERIPYNQYIEIMYNSRINLSLEGIGELANRHLEILANCSFMICQSSINELDLPLPLVDGKHFVTFKNKDDLLEKINFYLKNDKDRNEIALNGRKVLEKYYSPKKHGKFLFDKIFS